MAYEKYIKKDGKIYGPYLYHSRRIDGKVISEYHGQKKSDSWKFLWAIPVILLVIFGAYLIGQSGKGATGYSVLDLNANQEETSQINEVQKVQIPQEETKLTEKERAILLQEFGDLSVKQEAKSRNNLIIVRYEIGEHWIEHTYLNLNNEILNDLMKADRVKWLKDIAGRLSQENPKEPESLEISEVVAD